MNWEEAIIYIKQGGYVTRKTGWPKDSYVGLIEGTNIPKVFNSYRSMSMRRKGKWYSY